MNNQKATFRRLASGTPRNSATTWTEHLGPGVTIVWAERPDRRTRNLENEVSEERKFFRDFGRPPTRRHPGLQCR